MVDPTAHKIRVVLIDDHPVALAGIRLGLRRHADIELVGEASDGPAGLTQIVQQQPDVALVDLFLPGIDGLEIAYQARAAGIRSRMILISGDLSTVGPAQLSKSGISGLFQKSGSIDQLAELIRSVARDPERSPATPNLKTGLALLSDEERAVLVLIAKGSSLKQISQELGVSYKAADYLKQSVMRKLNLHNRVQLTLFAIRERLVEA